MGADDNQDYLRLKPKLCWKEMMSDVRRNRFMQGDRESVVIC